ncbi:MAG: radical SAM protein [Candidatus Aenigmarchaeota archaeon]|nr:radical SAM protein [Candidatus Aenigmarchaeota archaeon]
MMQPDYQSIECKSFLHKISNKFLPFNWGANPYRGCEHSCPYCFARYTHEYLGYNKDAEFDNKILVKMNAAEVLEKELSRKTWKNESVNLGSVCDPYQPAEKKFEITKQVLKVFAKHRTPLFVCTKSSLILRDIDLLSEMAKTSNLMVNITLTTLDENICKKIEPRASSADERLDAIKQLSDAGVTIGVLFMPIFPYLTDSVESINQTTKAVRDAGANDLIPGILGLKSSCKDRVLSMIKKEYPILYSRYLTLYKKAYAPKDYTKRIYKIIEIARRKYNMEKFELPEKPVEKQMSFKIPKPKKPKRVDLGL